MSAGRLRIETHPGGAIVPPFEVFDATSKGVLDVGIAPFGFIQGRHPATIPMSHGPLFGMDGMDYYAWYYDGGGMKLLEEFYRDILKLNLVGFPIPTDYPQGLGWFKKPITQPCRPEGHQVPHLRHRRGDLRQARRAGGDACAGKEIVPAMERGVIQGAEWINCLEDRKLGLHKVAKYYYTPGMHETVTGGADHDQQAGMGEAARPTCRRWSRWRACTPPCSATSPSTAKPPRPARS